MTRLLKVAFRRIHGGWTARRMTAALTSELDAHALTELGVPPAQPKFRLRDWLSPRL